MLGVVEDQQRSLPGEARGHAFGEVPARLLLDREGLCDRGDEQVRIPQRGQRHPPDAVLERVGGFGRRLDCEPCLACPPGPVRVTSRALSPQQFRDLGQLLLPAEERRRRHREVRAVQRLESRKRFVTELKDALRRTEVLERCSPRSASSSSTRLAVACRDHYLAAVAGSSDARSTVDVIADVALFGQ